MNGGKWSQKICKSQSEGPIRPRSDRKVKYRGSGIRSTVQVRNCMHAMTMIFRVHQEVRVSRSRFRWWRGSGLWTYNLHRKQTNTRYMSDSDCWSFRRVGWHGISRSLRWREAICNKGLLHRPIFYFRLPLNEVCIYRWFWKTIFQFLMVGIIGIVKIEIGVVWVIPILFNP